MKLINAQVPSPDADVHQTLMEMNESVFSASEVFHLLWEMLLNMLLILLLICLLKHLSTHWAVKHLGMMCNPRATRTSRDVGTLPRMIIVVQIT